jgi:hypothetical protein
MHPLIRTGGRRIKIIHGCMLDQPPTQIRLFDYYFYLARYSASTIAQPSPNTNRHPSAYTWLATPRYFEPVMMARAKWGGSIGRTFARRGWRLGGVRTSVVRVANRMASRVANA